MVSVVFQGCAKDAKLRYSICWKAPHADIAAMRKLAREKVTSCEDFKDGSQCMIACYALYKYFVSKVSGSPVLNEQHKAENFSCHVIGDQVVIKYVSSSTKSLLKKHIKAIIKNLDPSASGVKSYYKLGCRHLQCKFDEGVYVKCINELNAALKASLSIFAMGKVKIEQSEVQEVASAASPPSYATQKGASEYKARSHSLDMKDNTEVKCSSGIVPYLVADYVSATGQHFKAQVLGNSVLVWNRSAPSAKKESVQRWLETKYFKRGKNTTDADIKCRIGCYLFDRDQDAVPCSVLASLFSSALPKPNDLADKVVKCLS